MSIESLENIICDDCLVFPDVENAKIILPENKGVPYSLIIHNIPSDIFAIKSDSFADTRSFFKGEQGQNKRADYIIISKSMKLIIFLELKCGAGGSLGDIVKQLKGAECLLTYCDALNVKMKNMRSDLNQYDLRFVSVCHVTGKKRPTRSQKSKGALHDSPEKLLKLSSPHRLYFKQLKGLA